MKTRTYVKTRPEAVVHTEFPVMNDLSLGGAKYLVTFIDETFGYVKPII